MNHRLISTLGAALMITFIAACNVNVNDGSGTGLGPNGIPLDSGATITTHSERHSESNTNFELKGGIHSESHSTTHTTTTSGKQLTLGQQVDAWATELFPDYKVVEMDPMEAYPKYKGAQDEVFKRLRMKNPISNSYGKAVYPRVLLKGYRFIAPSALTKDVEEWLNSLGSETKGIQLGQAVKAVKSPPLLCAVIGNDFLVVQGGCVYEGPEWTASKKLFFEKMRMYGASYAFQVKCDGGELAYELGGNS
ncbi:MAG TPA: hypothetical protein VHS96_15250 [Bacteroidia bacterium]|nr:hypothetical protein [Bacteroidia bacterium]